MTEQRPVYLEYTRIDDELNEARRLLNRGDFEGARIAAWAARQLATRDYVMELLGECDELLARCDVCEDDLSARARRFYRGA